MKTMETGYLDVPFGRVHYRKTGQGKNLIVALHGFGVDGSLFSCLSTSLQEGQSLYALDLPWHGATQWHTPDFTPTHLKSILTALLEKEQGTTFTALGFSYGARLWLGALPLLMPACQKLILIAPEGFGGKWQWVMRLPAVAQKKISVLLQQYPELALRLAQILQQRKLLHPFALRFLQQQLSSPIQRERLLRAWASLHAFPLNQPGLLQALGENPRVQVHFVAGKKDPLLQLVKLQRWVKGLPRTHLHVYPFGHQIITRSEWRNLLTVDGGRWTGDGER